MRSAGPASASAHTIAPMAATDLFMVPYPSAAMPRHTAAGRVRQWLGTVPATMVWAVPQRPPLTAYDATGVALGSRVGGHVRAWAPQGRGGRH